MNNKVEVMVNGVKDSVEQNSTLFELSKKYNKGIPIMAAKINNRLISLDEKITKESDIEFIDITNEYGNKIYVNGLYFILIKAYKELYGYDKEVIIENSIDKGTYCTMSEAVTEDKVLEIKNKMKDIVNKDYKIEKISVKKEDAKEYYEKNNMTDKIGLFNTITSDVITLYRLENLYDYFYTIMPYSTEQINIFDLTYINKNGLILTYPTVHNKILKKYEHPEKIFNVFKEYTEWAKVLNVKNVSDLNKAIANGHGEEIIQISETMQNRRIGFVADEIYKRKDKLKVVLIAGPSSSGKTTTAKKLRIHLKTLGINTKNLSTDDYYVNRVDTPKKEDGTYDYETIDAIDLKLFNSDLKKIIDGETVNIPKYNFITGEKEFDKNNSMKLEENEMLIIEGIHAHNEKITSEISDNLKYKIYISPLTQLNLDNHNRIHTTDARLLRRMVRDNKYRGYNPAATIKEWKDVRAGEEKWIFPYQNNADVVLNSDLLYEIAVLKPYAEPLLYSVSKDTPEYIDAKRLIYFLRNFLPLSSETVPKDSHLREFIGGSSFRKEI